MSDDDLTVRSKKLRYRSWHRGTKELDLLLGPYADKALVGCDKAAMDTFETLMELPEPLIYSLLIGQQEPEGLTGMPEGFDALVFAIRDFHARPKRI